MDGSARRLENVLRRLRRRLALRRAAGQAVRAGWIAGAVAAGAALLGLLAPAAAIPAAILLPLVPLAAGGAAAWAWARRPCPAAVAAWADRACGLEERTSTAWGLVEREAGSAGAGAGRPHPLRDALVDDALAALARADLETAARLAAPRETPLLAGAVVALAALIAIPGAPPAGAGTGSPARAALRSAARQLAPALARPGVPDGLEAVAREARRVAEALKAGALSPEAARERLRELAGLVEAARAKAAARGGGSPEASRWLEDLLGAARAAELLAAEASGAGGASAGTDGGTAAERRLALEAAFVQGFAAPTAGRGRAAEADFTASTSPGGAGSSAATAPVGAGTAADLAALVAASRRALVERAWPRGRYDAVVDAYFGIGTARGD
jgi:hypothetical protein